MEWDAIRLSLALAGWTLAFLLPAGIVLARWLATARFAGRHWVEGLLALPLVLPPTVLGYYLLVAMGGSSSLGRWFQAATGTTLAFSFTGLVRRRCSSTCPSPSSRSSGPSRPSTPTCARRRCAAA